MYYLDDDLSLQEAHENKVFRYYGGDSDLEGGYVTPENLANPIYARDRLGLSQHDWTDEEGNPIRNLANNVAEGTIYTDDDGHIINLNGEVTDHVLDFTTVEPTSDMQGGGLEYHLEDNFYDVVEVESTESFIHQPTQGWSNYVEAEAAIINAAADTTSDESTSDISDTADDIIDATDNTDEIVDTISTDDLIDEDEYFIQRNDTDDDFYVEQCWDDDEGREERSLDDDWWVGETHDEESVDNLIDDAIYEVQSADVNESYYAEENIDTNDTDNTNDNTNDY